MQNTPELSDVSARLTRGSQYRTALAVGLVSIACLLTIVVCIAHLGPTFFRWKYDRVMDVKELPFGRLTLQGVVTYVDEVNRGFLIQDESGAMVIDLPPAEANVHYGQLVRVQARKIHDEQARFAGAALTDYRIRILKAHAALPVPATATVENLPEKE